MQFASDGAGLDCSQRTESSAEINKLHRCRGRTGSSNTGGEKTHSMEKCPLPVLLVKLLNNCQWVFWKEVREAKVRRECEQQPPVPRRKDMLAGTKRCSLILWVFHRLSYWNQTS